MRFCLYFSILSFFSGLTHTWSLHQGVLILKFWNFETKNLFAELWTDKECPKLLCGLGISHIRRQPIQMSNSSGWGGEEFFRASLYVWCVRYWALCDDLLVFKLYAGVVYLSFSIDTAPQWILWKRSNEDWYLRASRDGHSSSSSILPTLLVFRHLLQVQRAAVLWTFLIWLIWSFEWGLQMGAAYSRLGRTKVLYAISLVS